MHTLFPVFGYIAGCLLFAACLGLAQVDHDGYEIFWYKYAKGRRSGNFWPYFWRGYIRGIRYGLRLPVLIVGTPLLVGTGLILWAFDATFWEDCAVPWFKTFIP